MANDGEKILELDGEQIATVKEGDRVRVFRQKSEEYLMTTIKINDGATYAKLYNKPMRALGKELSGPEAYAILILSAFVTYASGELTYHNGVVLTDKHLAKELGTTRQNANKIMLKLQNKGVITKAGDTIKKYYVNPWVMQMGARISKTLHSLFRDSRWAKLAEKQNIKGVKGDADMF